MKKKDTNDILRATPLGGHGEIGKNSWLFEFKDEILIVNFGMMLPTQSLSGVDLILPNSAYLQENQKKIKGLVITSGHDDSCGGVFYLLSKVSIPKIWGSKLALEIIKNQFGKNISLPESEELSPRKDFQVGENFFIKSISNTSVLPDTYGLYIRTKAGNILYTGSYKIDQNPLDGVLLDYFSYSQAGEDGVDLLISDSANVESTGYSQAEVTVTKAFDEIIKDRKSKVIIVGSADNLYKYQIVIDTAKKYNKKIFISSDYLLNKIHSAQKTGFMTIDKDILVNKKDLTDIKDKDLIVLLSGKYGDFLSSLIEIAKEEHKDIKLKQNDIVVISANPPPGTARNLAHTIDQLYIQKVQVISDRTQRVHVSEHAAQEEVKFLITIAKPRSFAPSHGEERQMVLYANLAELIGISPNDIHILKNGDILELREQVARTAGKISAESIYYNSAKDLYIDETTIKERQSLSEEGTITVVLTIDDKINIIAGPEILAEACSFAKGKDWRAFCLGTIELIKDTIKQSVENEKNKKEPLNLKTSVRDIVNKNVLELIGKRPLINVTIQEVAKSTSTSIN